ncbi:SVOP [Symbiodinium sp. CCMP2456]|nr:SVOP [Symbiodinium sp. CCMP2456]
MFSSKDDDPDKTEGSAKSVVLSKRLSEDYIENTLVPHLESQLLDNIHIYTPAELAQIAKAYAKQDVRQRALCQKLADTMKFRIKGFEAIDVVDCLGPMWIMTPDDDELFEMLEQRILEKMDDFTALNFMGIVRIYNKRASKHHDLLSKVIPRLKELLATYEGVELSEMLVSMAQSSEASADMDILMTLVPEIERRYNDVSLLHAINNVWALTQMKINHQGLLKRVAEDVSTPHKVKDLTPGYMGRLVWVYRLQGPETWALVKDALLPLVRGAAAEFKAGDFARMAQALPEEQQFLRRVAGNLQPTLPDMGRQEFLLFLLGCIHGEVLEDRPDAGQDFGELTASCLNYIKEDQDNFKRDEVQKIVYLLHFSPKYHYLVDEMPVSWNATKQETLDFIRAKGFRFLPAAPAQAGPWLRASRLYFYVRSMHKGYSSCDGASLPIGQVLDELPLSSFHIGHVLWTAAAVALFAIHCELTPYMFPGLQIHFGADKEELSTYAAAFQAGCAFGALVAPVLVDKLGRKPTLVFGAIVTTLLNYGSAFATSFNMILILRTLSSSSWAIAYAALGPWYVEFLPTTARGAMLAAITLGWPAGRAAVIVSSDFFNDDWQKLLLLAAVAMGVLLLSTTLIHESPRYLVATGRIEEAKAVLSDIHRRSGARWSSDCRLCLDHTSLTDERSWYELFSAEYFAKMRFSLILFSLLSMTTCLIDTWGPMLFQNLMFPEDNALPRMLLMIFNLGDLCGLVVSILVVDFIGRKGSFFVGFGFQGTLLLCLAGTHSLKSDDACLYLQSILGAISASCRGFAWEAAVMWSLEAFPTSLRAAALSLSRVVMHSSAVITLKVSAQCLSSLPAFMWLQILGSTCLAAGVIVAICNPTESAGKPLTEHSSATSYRACSQA